MDEGCIFCRIIARQLPSNFLLETDRVVAFQDVHPQAPVHVLVIPKEHVAGLQQLAGADPTWNALIGAVQEIAASQRLDGGFRVVVNQGADGGQSVPHLHLHVLGKRAMSWPPG